MIYQLGALASHKLKGRAQWIPSRHLRRNRGFTLIEALVSLFLLGVVGVLIGAAFSFSVKSQQDSGLQLKAVRSASRVLEVLRTANFDSIEPIESGWPSFAYFSTREKQVLADVQDKLLDNGLNVSLTVRRHEDQDDAKYMTVNVRSNGLSNGVLAVAQGEISVRMATLVTRRGLNP